MWIVRLALRRPYTFVVMAMLIVIAGRVRHLAHADRHLSRRWTSRSSRSFGNTTACRPRKWKGASSALTKASSPPPSTTSSTSKASRSTAKAVIRILLPARREDRRGRGAGDGDFADGASRRCRPGIQPPLIHAIQRIDGADHLQLSLGSNTLPEQTALRHRQQLPAATTWPPCRGRWSPGRMAASSGRSWSIWSRTSFTASGSPPADVSNAINAQNLIVPSGTAKIGTQEYPVHLNSSPDVLDELNDLPIKTINGTTVYIKDVGPRQRQVHAADQPGAQSTARRACSSRSTSSAAPRRWTSSSASTKRCRRSCRACRTTRS